jgi:hypothetical protein
MTIYKGFPSLPPSLYHIAQKAKITTIDAFQGFANGLWEAITHTPAPASQSVDVLGHEHHDLGVLLPQGNLFNLDLGEKYLDLVCASAGVWYSWHDLSSGTAANRIPPSTPFYAPLAMRTNLSGNASDGRVRLRCYLDARASVDEIEVRIRTRQEGATTTFLSDVLSISSGGSFSEFSDQIELIVASSGWNDFSLEIRGSSNGATLHLRALALIATYEDALPDSAGANVYTALLP